MTLQQPYPVSLLEKATAQRRPVGYVLLFLSFVAAALTLFLLLRWTDNRNLPETSDDPSVEVAPPGAEKKKEPAVLNNAGDYFTGGAWSALVAIVLLIAGVWNLTRPADTPPLIHETRILFMLVGGLCGIFTALLGFALMWRWQKSVLLWVNQGETAEAKWVLAAVAVFFVGLAILFFSVQLGRAEERSSVFIRRLLYGTNAVLSGLLLLLVLVIVNVAVFLKLPDNVITTAAAFKGLTGESREFLRTLGQPVKLYLVMPENLVTEDGYVGLYSDCRTLLRSCEDENANIKAVFLSPATDMDEIRRAQERLDIGKDMRNRYGIMIGYGDSEQPSGFIPIDDMFANHEGRDVFQGEAKLMTELNFLNSGGTRPVIYFTQSNGEPSMTGPSENNPRSCVEIVRELTERKYTVKPLLLEPGKQVDVTDASLIVIPAPRTPFTAEQSDMLRQYLDPPANLKAIPGRIVACLPATAAADGNVAATGLEALFNDFGIRIEAKRLLTMPDQRIPTGQVMGIIAQFLNDEKQLPFGNVRVILPMTGGPPNLRTLPVLANMGGIFVYQDARFNSDPEEVTRLIIKEGQQNSAQTRNEKQVSNTRVPFSVITVEVGTQQQAKEPKPRVIAIGTDWLIDDAVLKQASLHPENYKRLLGKIVEQMRERPESMKIEPRALGTFSLPKGSDSFGLYFMPLILISLAIFGLGFGVWFARRR